MPYFKKMIKSHGGTINQNMYYNSLVPHNQNLFDQKEVFNLSLGHKSLDFSKNLSIFEDILLTFRPFLGIYQKLTGLHWWIVKPK